MRVVLPPPPPPVPAAAPATGVGQPFVVAVPEAPGQRLGAGKDAEAVSLGLGVGPGVGVGVGFGVGVGAGVGVGGPGVGATMGIGVGAGVGLALGEGVGVVTSKVAGVPCGLPDLVAAKTDAGAVSASAGTDVFFRVYVQPGPGSDGGAVVTVPGKSWSLPGGGWAKWNWRTVLHDPEPEVYSAVKRSPGAPDDGVTVV